MAGLTSSQRPDRSWQEQLLRLLPYVFGMGVAFVLSRRMLGADFCIIDDHAEALWLGKAGGALPFHGIWPALMDTEVGELGTSPRFRPVYYFYMIVETWVLGDHPLVYHALRIVFFGLLLGALGNIARRGLGLVPSFAVMFAIGGLGFWSDIWTLSFGPTEQIATLGVALFLIAAAKIVACYVHGDEYPQWAFPLASLGMAIAAGSKENFVVWLGAFLLLALMLVVSGKHRSIGFYLSFLPLVVPASVLYALSVAAKSTTDFYGADNSVHHRLATLIEHPGFLLICAGAVVGVTVVSAAASKLSRQPKPALRRATLAFIAIVGLLVLDILWEQFFYVGRLPSYIRYDFPFMLLPCSIVLAFAGFLRFAFADLAWWGRWAGQLALLVLTLVCIRDAHMTFSLPRASQVAVDRTTAFRRDFTKFRDEAGAHPDWPIILASDSPWDFEPIRTFKVWMHFYQIKNPVFLRLDTIPKESISTPFLASLADAVKNEAASRKSSIVPPLTDLATVQKMGGKCIALGFHNPPTSPCNIKWIRLGEYIPDS